MLIGNLNFQTLLGLFVINPSVFLAQGWNRICSVVKFISWGSLLRFILCSLCLIGAVFNAGWVVYKFASNYALQLNWSELWLPILCGILPFTLCLLAIVLYAGCFIWGISTGITNVVCLYLDGIYLRFIYILPIMRAYFICLYAGLSYRWYNILGNWLQMNAEASFGYATLIVLLPLFVLGYALLIYYMLKVAPQLDQVMSSRIFALVYFHLVVFGFICFGICIISEQQLMTVSLIYYATDFGHSYNVCQLLHAGEDSVALAYMNGNRNELILEMNSNEKFGDHWREQMDNEFAVAANRNSVIAAIYVRSNPSETLSQVHVFPTQDINGAAVENIIIIPKKVQAAKFPADSVQIVRRPHGKWVFINALWEYKVTKTRHFASFADTLNNNGSNQHCKAVNLPTYSVQTADPEALGQAALINAPKEPNAYAAFLTLLKPNKDLYVDLYQKFTADKFEEVHAKLLARGMTPEKVVAMRNKFIYHDLGFKSHITDFSQVKQPLSHMHSYHNVRVVDLVTKRPPFMSVSSQMKAILTNIVKKV